MIYNFLYLLSLLFYAFVILYPIKFINKANKFNIIKVILFLLIFLIFLRLNSINNPIILNNIELVLKISFLSFGADFCFNITILFELIYKNIKPTILVSKLLFLQILKQIKSNPTIALKLIFNLKNKLGETI